MSTRWAAGAWHFVHNVAALLAFMPFVIACIAIPGIKPVNCAVRDLLSAIFELRCPASPRAFPVLAPCQSCARFVVLDRGPQRKSVAVHPAQFNCQLSRLFPSNYLRSFCQRTFGRIFARTTCHWLWLLWGTKQPVCLMAFSCLAAKHVTE